MKKMHRERFKELPPEQQEVIEELVNTLASHQNLDTDRTTRLVKLLVKMIANDLRRLTLQQDKEAFEVQRLREIQGYDS
tara:strand:+ start:3372 stop:3608 length:237 start_codon:yes stop_codon:yes gene_type:complete